MGLELGKWFYSVECMSDNGDRLVDLREQTGLIIASVFKGNDLCYQLTCQGLTLLMSKGQLKRKMRTLKLQLDYVLSKNIPHSDIRKSRAIWYVLFDFDHRPVLLSLRTVVPQEKPNRSSSTENRYDRPERRRMQNEIPPMCVYSYWSTDQGEALLCGFLHKVHPGGCKGNTSGSNAAEEVCLRIGEYEILVYSFMDRPQH
ncbi:hypothetical protein RB195_005044 [Necator americanus]|uniref:Uncharacterized protein n=1 Tax=Necator americanus TaxID=51031 RepID=A0ABR1BPU3_NECAM